MNKVEQLEAELELANIKYMELLKKPQSPQNEQEPAEPEGSALETLEYENAILRKNLERKEKELEHLDNKFRKFEMGYGKGIFNF